MIDTIGTAVVYYKYDARGKPISKTGIMAATLGTLNPFRYRGDVFDEETTFYYLQSRFYRPTWSRFVSADVLFDGCLYAYCSNQPINFFDPHGKSALATLLSEFFENLCDGGSDKSHGYYSISYDCAVNSSLYRGGLVNCGYEIRSCPNPYGRAGSPAHRSVINDAVERFGGESGSFTVEYEYRIPTDDGHYRLADAYIENDGDVLIIQVGVSNKNGTPVSRERYALQDISNHAKPNWTLLFIPYKVK